MEYSTASSSKGAQRSGDSTTPSSETSVDSMSLRTVVSYLVLSEFIRHCEKAPAPEERFDVLFEADRFVLGWHRGDALGVIGGHVGKQRGQHRILQDVLLVEEPR